MKARVLVVDDEPSIAEILEYNLSREGFDVTTAFDGHDAIAKARTSPPDLIILDLMMPGLDGLGVCRQVRSEPKLQSTRVLMLTAKGEETDEIVGFRMGADDYVTKPFRIKPLIERVKALLRRTNEPAVDKNTVIGEGIELDRVSHTCTIDGVEAFLTPTEFRLLWAFLRQPRRTYSRSELMDFCRGEDANSLERTIDVHIRSLRKKIGDKADVIETVRGVGYRYRPSQG
eukprot:TRINITY_DN10083_c0_g1_i1.p1 TRINITY_DN10083_c0_g1~~TRINITY_DN10083_c0_g1_i1.p1  ORF type:complete len:230 (+),score=29.04 TRINITY_DN10083_c0_g1_i1:168-857(+)